MESDSDLPTFCIVCLKQSTIQNLSDASPSKFCRIWQKFVQKNYTSTLDCLSQNPNIAFCSDCEVVATKFCDHFKEWELLRLKLEWNLEKLVNNVIIASRHKYRTDHIRKATCEGKTLVNQLARWHRIFKLNSKEILGELQPRVLVERLHSRDKKGSNGNHEVFIEQDLETNFVPESPEILENNDGDEDYRPNSRSDSDNECGNSAYLDEDVASLDDNDLSFSDRDNEETTSNRNPNNEESRKPNKPSPETTITLPPGSCLKNHSCSQCSEKFYTDELRQIHETYHSNFPCNFCDQVCDFAPDLSLHEVQTHGEKEPFLNRKGILHSVRCPRCPYTCNTSPTFVRHHLKDHLGLETVTLKCSVCGGSFASPMSLRFHMRKSHQTKEEIHQCTDCPAHFSQASKLAMHQSKVHLKSKKCRICERKFPEIRKLRQHMRLFHPDQSTGYGYKLTCNMDGCSKSFPTQKWLQWHEKTCRLNPLSILTCPDCDYTCRKFTVLRQHRAYRHTPPEEWKWECVDCKKNFATKKLLGQHSKMHVIKENRIYCFWCSSQFGTESNWVNHTKRRHADKMEEMRAHTASESTIAEEATNSLNDEDIDKFLLDLLDAYKNPTQDSKFKKEVSWIRSEARKVDRRKRVKCTVPNCTAKLLTDEQRLIHETYHGTFQCQFCPEVKTFATDLATHEVEAHGPKEPIKGRNGKIHSARCPRCPYSCRVFQYLIRHHLEMHLGLENISIKCTICQSGFSDPKTLRKHKKQVHQIEGLEEFQIMRCSECPAYFTKAEAIVDHKNKIHLKGKKCPVCPETFVTMQMLRRHISSKHPEHADFGFQFSCDMPYCEKEFKSEKAMQLHRKLCQEMHDNPEMRRLIKYQKDQRRQKKFEQVGNFQCPKCPKKFFISKKLDNHMHFVHSDTRRLCSICGKGYKTMTVLRRHMEYHKSPEEWRFQCSVCGRKFIERNLLKNHQRTHTKEKPFVCQWCGAAYGYKHSWLNHVKTKHPENAEECLD